MNRSHLSPAVAPGWARDRGSIRRRGRQGCRTGSLRGRTGRAEGGAHGDAVIGVEGDVRFLDSHKEATAKCVESFGKLDCLVGNAGVWDYSTALVDIPEDRIEEAFDEMFSINVKGYLLSLKAGLEALYDSKGTAIFTVSNAGFYPAGGGALYTSAKHAVVGMVKQMAYELGPHIRVNGIAPGGIGGSDLRGLKALDLQDTSISTIPLGEMLAEILPTARMATAEEYAGAWVFVSPDRHPAPDRQCVELRRRPRRPRLHRGEPWRPARAALREGGIGLSVRRLGYLGIEVSDVDAWRTFATSRLGAMEAPTAGGAGARFRLDSRSWRFEVTPGLSDDLALAGYEVDSEEALAEVKSRLEDFGIKVTTESPSRSRAWGARPDLVHRSHRHQGRDLLRRDRSVRGAVHAADRRHRLPDGGSGAGPLR